MHTKARQGRWLFSALLILLLLSVFLRGRQSQAAGNLSDFLEIPSDPRYFKEILLSDQVNDPAQDYILASSITKLGNKLGLYANEGGYLNYVTFGGNFVCNNVLHGTPSLCRYMTGGNPEYLRTNTNWCGQSMNNDYQYALQHPENVCTPGVLHESEGARFFFGNLGQDTFVMPEIFNDIPANRLCFEVEIPASLVAHDFPSRGSIPAANLEQVVNPTGDPNIDLQRFTWGTFTSIYGSDKRGYDRYNNEGPGDRHFYGTETTYGQRPIDKAYYLGQHTFLACMGDHPTGTRGEARPTYFANPLAFAGYMYMPYITRIYFDAASNADVIHPATYKINKVMAFYERNHIQAYPYWASDMKATRTSPVTYTFTVYNDRKESVDYDVFMISGGCCATLSFDGRDPQLLVYNDRNNNGIVDAGDTEVTGRSTITFPAATTMHFIAVHNPTDSEYGWLHSTVYNADYARATVAFVAKKEMKATSFQMVTWFPTTPSDYANKTALLAARRYGDFSSIYLANAQWNQGKPNNPRLIENSPDFLALVPPNAASASSTSSSAPTVSSASSVPASSSASSAPGIGSLQGTVSVPSFSTVSSGPTQLTLTVKNTLGATLLTQTVSVANNAFTLPLTAAVQGTGPFTVVVSATGYASAQMTVSSALAGTNLAIRLKPDLTGDGVLETADLLAAIRCMRGSLPCSSVIPSMTLSDLITLIRTSRE